MSLIYCNKPLYKFEVNDHFFIFHLLRDILYYNKMVKISTNNEISYDWNYSILEGRGSITRIVWDNSSIWSVTNEYGGNSWCYSKEKLPFEFKEQWKLPSVWVNEHSITFEMKDVIISIDVHILALKKERLKKFFHEINIDPYVRLTYSIVFNSDSDEKSNFNVEKPKKQSWFKELKEIFFPSKKEIVNPVYLKKPHKVKVKVIKDLKPLKNIKNE